MKKNITQKKFLIPAAGILALIALIALSFFVFWSNIEKSEIARSEKNLSNIAESNVKSVNFTVQSYIDELKAIAFAVERYDDFISAEPMSLLKNISDAHGYERLAIAYPDGMTYASDGNILSITSITKIEHIKKGEIFVEDVIDALVDKKPIINVFVPLRDKTGEPVAALRLTISTEKFTKTLALTFFSGGGYYYLIDKNGRFTATNLPEEKILEQNYFDGLQNFEFREDYSAEKLRRGFAERKPGFAKYAYNGVERYVHYTPTGINEWILLTVVPKHVMAAPQNEIFYYSALLMLQLLAIIIAVFAYFYIKSSREQVTREETLRQKAERDQLTGLFNKLTTEYLVKEAIASYDPSKGNHALFIIDIDDFKNVNDMMGHLYGDIVLTLLADLLKPLFRTDDVLGRIGGDEFFVLLKNFHSKSLLESKASEICNLFHRSFSENDKTCTVSASVGIAIYPSDGESFDALYRNADSALYIAKENGKNGYAFFDGKKGSGYKSARTDIERNNPISQKNFTENKLDYIFKLLFDSPSPSDAARAILQLIVTQYDFSGSYIYELSEDETLFTNTYEYIADGSVSAMGSFGEIPAGLMPEAFDALKDKGLVLLDNLLSLSQENREIMSGIGIKSLYLFGTAPNGKLSGFIGFDDCKKERSLADNEIQDIKMVCDILFMFITKQRKM